MLNTVDLRLHLLQNGCLSNLPSKLTTYFWNRNIQVTPPWGIVYWLTCAETSYFTSEAMLLIVDVTEKLQCIRLCAECSFVKVVIMLNVRSKHFQTERCTFYCCILMVVIVHPANPFIFVHVFRFCDEHLCTPSPSCNFVFFAVNACWRKHIYF